MLKAILGGKGRRLPEGATAGDSYRSVFRVAEDLLTAAVFGRLTYLDPAVAWDILRTASGGALERSTGGIELAQADFWPSWSLTAKDGSRSVEPDVFLRYELTEPDVRVDLVVECKGGGGHDVSQWAREWKAHAETYPGEGVPRRVHLLAVGTWGTMPAARVASLLAHPGATLPTALNVIPISWHGLADALSHAEVTGGDRHVVADMLAALALHGHRSVRALGALRPDSVLAAGYREALSALGDFDPIELPRAYRPDADPGADTIAAWPERITDRPVAHVHPVLRSL